MKKIITSKRRNNLLARYVVRPVTHSDIVALLRLEREIYHGVLQWSKLTFERELNNPEPHMYLLVEHHQDVIAFIGVRLQQREAHITNLAVSPHYRRQGIASALMSRAERYAKRHRCTTITLEVRMTNFVAKRFYRRRQYKTKRILHDYYLDNYEDGVVMEKEL